MDKSIGTTNYRALLALLRSMRTEAGITQDQLAERLGRAQTWVSKTELGERRIDLEELRQWSDALGVDVRDLVAEWLDKLARPSRQRPR